ncbi:hypothetical protein PC9H_004267 [Pleurotus ostreatus]|uniref:DUF3752 domain-containing protein n=1 Tax=Pleurotus ostreatus TaxID=5322 RepID=A0A8H6ZZY8_PLEOS|nr:uncharacterized protein PC9H_004267 [Pleurotus ostreatus]KAF7437428.1 hypothetical protein PC9H_004267 [Pleurotus ostreatus]
MPSIGPEIPAHLLRNTTPGDEQQGEPSIGPKIPHALTTAPDDDDDDDDYTPLPPDLVASRSSDKVRPARPILGPSFPPAPGSSVTFDDSDDDEVGPKPLPAGIKYREQDAVAQFIEKEEARRKNAEEAAKPKTLKRDEWMLVPPSSSDLLGNLDPTKLNKPRQFSRSAAPAREVDNSLWTETPAERQQRIADEVAGKKRRAANAEPALSVEEELEMRKKRRVDEAIRKGVEEHTRNIRGSALVDRHAKSSKQDDDPKASAIWEHGRDMSLGGRLMDDSTRAKMLKDAKSLGDRFGSGSKGGFL